MVSGVGKGTKFSLGQVTIESLPYGAHQDL